MQANLKDVDSDKVLPSEIEKTKVKAHALEPVDHWQNLNAPSLQTLQSILLHGGEIGTWRTPNSWAREFPPTLRAVNIRNRCIAALPQGLQNVIDTGEQLQHARLLRLIDQAVVKMTQYLLLMRAGPSGMKRASNRSLKPTAVAHFALNYLPIFAAAAVVKQWNSNDTNSGSKFFSLVTAKDFSTQPEHVRERFLVELKRMNRLKDFGVWSDVFSFTKTQVATPVKLENVEVKREAEAQPHHPFPDQWVSQMGICCTWLIEELGPSLIRLLDEMRPIWEMALSQETPLEHDESYRLFKPTLKNFKFLDSNGKLIKKFPFPIFQRGRGARLKASKPFSWPLKTVSEVFDLVSLLQSAHMFVVFLSLGVRVSELRPLERSSVSDHSDGYAYLDGRTYKLSELPDGEVRDWVLPDFAVGSIRQQEQLVSKAEVLCNPKLGISPTEIKPGKHLWGNIGTGILDRREVLRPSAVNEHLRALASALGLGTSPGGQPVNSHRFRKTLARLCALAIVEAPRILMDVFGHKDIAMTLHYILTNKSLRAEIETVARELRLMRATDVVKDMLLAEEAAAQTPASYCQDAPAKRPTFGDYRGPAAAGLRQAVKTDRERRFKTGEDFGVESASELAEILTMNGAHWDLVRPGIICTKSVGVAGPCNNNRGRPDRGNCQSTCASRLEQGWLVADTDGAIADCKKHYLSAGLNGADLMQSYWANQVRENLTKFEEVRVKWEADPVIKQMLETA